MADYVGDCNVYYTQKWVNENFKGEDGYTEIELTGKTGWTTIYALLHALQITLNVGSTADNFGNGTVNAFNNYVAENGSICQQDEEPSTEQRRRINGIIQGALLCKGYEINSNTPTGNFYSGTGNAIKNLKEDAGLSDTSTIVTLNIMKALLSMDYFYSYDTSETTQNIIEMQRYLNGNYEDYIGLRPCDGVYGRRTNQGLILAIQAEEGMSTSVANGNCGPSTKRCLPTLIPSGTGSGTNYSGDSYTVEEINKFKILANMALYFNGFGSGSITSTLNETVVKNFQSMYSLTQTGNIDYTTWLSLLISCGDVDRKAVACDCATILTDAKAKTLYDNGYLRVGRYLTGTIASGASKALTKDELQIAADNGLYVFPIYQTSANSISYFTIENAQNDVEKAFEAANNLWLPSDTDIYFAVDCDPQSTEIYSNILPYFRKLNEIMKDNYNNKYNICVYGTRNVCKIISENELAKYSFVSDMSSGFSGNLGFSIPDNWSFDQFTTITIGSDEGEIEIDKDASSGKDLGLIGDTYLKDYGKVYNDINDMYNLALEYTNNDELKSNMLVLQYIRKGKYGDTTIFGGSSSTSNYKWKVVAGSIDSDYCDLVDSKLYNLTFEFYDSTRENAPVMHDLPHLAAALNALLYQFGDDDLKGYDEIIDCYAGWAGDAITFADSIQEQVNDGIEDYEDWTSENICKNDETKFGYRDYIADIDAYNLYNMIKNGSTLPIAFYSYYVLPSLQTHVYQYTKRASLFINYMSSTRFIELCELITSDNTPYKEFKLMLTSADQKYIDVAVENFRKFIFHEYSDGR